MSEKPAASRRSITSFAADDDIPVPTAEQLAAAKSAGEGLGFRSEKPAPAPAQRPAPKVRQPTFTDAVHVRCRPEDRARFEDFVWRNRVSKGEAMTLLLDLALTEEARKAKAGK
ncbi:MULTISPECIES: hypothetical protein [Bacteria]|jgi:hypothetical protein|uniref:Uncharacterized protein n=4 Tax=Sphingomonas TaxID=13687 RepID=A0A0D1MEH3_9SPHN|nr:MULTISPECIES: hypothetical protein [Bacteria]KIU26081.1 hypothetical protein SR41_16475 [Sphingomonas melonis]MBB3877147.1 hypothetical protein [Sphingomonas aquatilis]MBB4049213.1 hypothetical protein [Sphingomonas zeae]MBB4610492.1 hypothetical protein [Sphingomonas yabuuchiae]MBN3557563.1 hypothetical protein [Sphingomonas yabuuchiae]